MASRTRTTLLGAVGFAFFTAGVASAQFTTIYGTSTNVDPDLIDSV